MLILLQKSGGVSSELKIEVGKVLPGMEDYEKIIEVKNKGEVGAKLDYSILSVKIMDEYYEVTENSGITSEELENKIKNDYPFKINIRKDDSNLDINDGNGNFVITVVWPFESGDDAKDTEWGNKAYEFYEQHPDENCIEIKLILKAEQSSGN